MRTPEEMEEAMLFLRKADQQSHAAGDREGSVSARMAYEVLCWAYGEDNEFSRGLAEAEAMRQSLKNRRGGWKEPRGRRRRGLQ